jgi:acetyl-CoA synthetase
VSSLSNPNYKSKNSIELYKDRYNESIKCNDSFWGKVADRITWIKTWDTISNVDYNTATIKWFEGAKLNASDNICLSIQL